MISKSCASITILALALVLGGCGKPQEPPAPPASPAATTAATPQAAAREEYDPKKDPLVNPKTLFEPAPADSSKIAEDETIVRNLDGNPSSLNPLFRSSVYEGYIEL